jgi:hypothetical protein
MPTSTHSTDCSGAATLPTSNEFFPGYKSSGSVDRIDAISWVEVGQTVLAWWRCSLPHHVQISIGGPVYTSWIFQHFETELAFLKKEKYVFFVYHAGLNILSDH